MNRQILFSLDIQINKKTYKLPVQSSDSIHELTNRLFQITSTNKQKQNKVSLRLKDQLSILLKNDLISQKIRSKIKDLFNRTNRQGEEDMNGSTETPFRILQDSILYSKINCKENSYRQIHSQQSPKLKYQYHQQPKEMFQKEVQRSKSPSFYQAKEDKSSNQKKLALREINKNTDHFSYQDYRKDNENIYNDLKYVSKYQKYNNRTQLFTENPYPIHRNYPTYQMDTKFSKLNLSPSKILTTDNRQKTFMRQHETNNSLPLQIKNDKRITRKYNYLDTQFSNQ